MAYFGGGGVKGKLDPSLHLYIECFHSPPFPKRYPRAGGILDQDPLLMRDFRVIRDYELQWKETQEQQRELQEGRTEEGGGGLDLGSALDELSEQLEGEDW